MSIEHIINLVDNINLLYGSVALENSYWMSEKTKQFVKNCCKDDWCQEFAFQIQSEEAFKDILLETNINYKTIRILFEESPPTRNSCMWIFARTSTFNPPNAYCMRFLKIKLHFGMTQRSYQ
jgi:hypothetical protein